MAMAEIAAGLGDPMAPALIAAVPGQAQRNFLEATYALASAPKDVEKAAAALAKAFIAYRTDPWVLLPTIRTALDVAVQLGSKNPVAAKQLYEALGQPFAAEAMRLGRLTSRARIAVRIDARTCVEALDAISPPRWERGELRLRVACYRETKDPRLAEAEDDLVRMLADTTPFAGMLPGGAFVLDTPEPTLGPVPADGGAPKPVQDAAPDATTDAH
jgi:hypothetical protein